MKPRLGSMFSGVGGLDLAIHAALDAETVFVADVCKFDKDGNPGHHEPHRSPCSVLARRFPDAPNLGDVLIHPDQYGDGLEKWPDGEIVILDTTLEPDDFAGGAA